MTRRRIPALIAAAAALAAAAPATALQPPPLQIGPPPELLRIPGLVDMQTLSEDMAAYLQRTRGDPSWPSEMLLPTPGMSRDDYDNRAYSRIADADMFDLDGRFTGPGGLSRAFSRSYPNAGGSSGHNLGEGFYVAVIGRAEGGRLDLSLGARHDGASHIGSVAGLRSGSTFTLQLGGGYAFTGTLTQRDPTDDERARNMAQANASREVMLQFREQQAAADSEPGAPVIVSPFTNSIIREGDPRARGAE